MGRFASDTNRLSGRAAAESDVRGTRLTVGGQQVVGSRKGAIADPQGGGTIDDVARSTMVAILAALRGHGLIGTS
ncbi:hypothetical protein MOP88_03590 [Sphingomonas sp. WKB10]|nr:hypothetical protein [Sphingomonas sp. WKB10]